MAVELRLSEKGDHFPPIKLEIVDAMEIAAEKSGFPPKLLARQLDFADLNVLPLSVALPLPSPHPPLPRVKFESPSEQLHTITEAKDVAKKEQKRCKCKQSRCLKLYCECFSSGTYCEGCSCVKCQNNIENEAARAVAIEWTLGHRPNAFRPKIATPDDVEEAENIMSAVKHSKGCHCKKSRCLRRYCECFQAEIPCSKNCKCVDCQNFEKGEQVSTLSKGSNRKSMAFINHTNAAIIGAIGFSGNRSSRKSMKRKYEDCFPASIREDPQNCKLIKDQQIVGSAALASSKITYRSLLAGTIEQQDTRELCSILVVASQAAMILADQNSSANIQPVAKLDEEYGHKGPEVHKTMPIGYLGKDQENENSKGDTAPGDADVQEVTPKSPETLALLCDEENMSFMPDASSDLMNYMSNTDTYVEQERLVLMQFRDCLNRLITCGNIRGTECLLSAEDEAKTSMGICQQLN